MIEINTNGFRPHRKPPNPGWQASKALSSPSEDSPGEQRDFYVEKLG